MNTSKWPDIYIVHFAFNKSTELDYRKHYHKRISHDLHMVLNNTL